MEGGKKILFWPTSPFITNLMCEPFFRRTKNRHCDEEIELSRMKSVLVVRLDQIGDVVMTTPFLRELRRNLPDAWISLIVLPSVLNLVEKCPHVNEVLSSGWMGDRDMYRFQRHWLAWKFAKAYLQQRQFDLAILPRRDTDQSHGAILAYFSGAQHRVGYSDSNHTGKPPYYRNNDCLLTRVLLDNNIRHEVESNLALIRFLGGDLKVDKMEIWLSPEDERFAEQILKAHKNQPHALLVGFAPGAAHPKRIWPLSRFVMLGNWLKNKYNATIVLVGGPGEKLLGQELEQHLTGAVVNIVGKATLRQTAAVLGSCHLFVGNDSGPMHLAVARGVPVVEISAHPLQGALFSPHSPKRFGPWKVPHRILQPDKLVPPCSISCINEGAHCILSVTIEKMKEAVTELLSDQGYSMLDKEAVHER